MRHKRSCTLEGPFIDADGKRYYRVRVRLADGTRSPRYRVPEDKCYSKERARGWGEWLQEQEDAKGKILAKRQAAAGESHAGETCDVYFDRWTRSREGRVRTVDDERGRWKKWISPHLGPKPVATLPKRALEELVSKLDAAVVAGTISWKTALHVWGVVTKMFDDAQRSKDLGLRVREDNPARDVRGPDRGHDRASAFLFPSELDKLLSKATVPVARRRMYALAVYLGCRAGELRALEWDDVHEEQGFVHVHRSHDRLTGQLKTTKTARARRIPIEPALLPLLAAMRDKCGGKGRVLGEAPPHGSNVAEILRADLAHADCRRAELTADDETRRPIDFHDLRHTYGTWRAIRGDELTKISRAMGHTTTAMTERYVNEAEAFDLGGAAIFAPLPESLDHPMDHGGGFVNGYGCEGRELNPYRSYPTRT